MPRVSESFGNVWCGLLRPALMTPMGHVVTDGRLVIRPDSAWRRPIVPLAGLLLLAAVAVPAYMVLFTDRGASASLVFWLLAPMAVGACALWLIFAVFDKSRRAVIIGGDGLRLRYGFTEHWYAWPDVREIEVRPRPGKGGSLALWLRLATGSGQIVLRPLDARVGQRAAQTIAEFGAPHGVKVFLA